MIRLAAVIEALGRGGAERLLVDTARLLDRSRFALHVYTLFPTRRDYAETLRVLDVPELCLDLAGPRQLARGIRGLRAAFRERPPDVVHTHLFCANVVGRIAGRLAGRPVVTTYHDADYESVVREGNPGLTPLKHWALRVTDALTAAAVDAPVLAVSEYVAASIRRRLRIPAQRISILANAVDTDTFAPDAQRRAAARAALSLDAEQPVALCVGRMTPQKGQDLLLRAFAEVLRQAPNARLLLVGDGAYRRHYEQMADSLGVAPAARFLGVRADVPDLMRAADVLVLPSRHEGFGLALVEALASGLAVLATRTGPMPEIVREGETGRLFDPDDVPGLTRALTELLRDPALRRAMSDRGRADAMARFSLPPMIARLEALYAALAAGRA